MAVLYGLTGFSELKSFDVFGLIAETGMTAIDEVYYKEAFS